MLQLIDLSDVKKVGNNLLFWTLRKRRRRRRRKRRKDFVITLCFDWSVTKRGRRRSRGKKKKEKIRRKRRWRRKGLVKSHCLARPVKKKRRKKKSSVTNHCFDWYVCQDLHRRINWLSISAPWLDGGGWEPSPMASFVFHSRWLRKSLAFRHKSLSSFILCICG